MVFDHFSCVCFFLVFSCVFFTAFSLQISKIFLFFPTFLMVLPFLCSCVFLKIFLVIFTIFLVVFDHFSCRF